MSVDKLKKTIKVVLAIIVMIWLSLYLLSSVVYQHDELYNHNGNNFDFGYSRYNSQGVEDAWNFSKNIDGHRVYVEIIECCYIEEDTAYLASADKEYVVLNTVSGEFVLYEGPENITNEGHLRTFKFISSMDIIRGILFGKYESRELV